MTQDGEIRDFRLRPSPGGAPWWHMTAKSCTCNQTPNDLLTVSEAASVAGVSEKTLRRRIRSRELDHLRVGSRSIRIRRGDLEKGMNVGLVPAVSDGEVL